MQIGGRMRFGQTKTINLKANRQQIIHPPHRHLSPQGPVLNLAPNLPQNSRSFLPNLQGPLLLTLDGHVHLFHKPGGLQKHQPQTNSLVLDQQRDYLRPAEQNLTFGQLLRDVE